MEEMERIPDIVFQDAFLRTWRGDFTILVLLARDRHIQMIFARMDPTKGSLTSTRRGRSNRISMISGTTR